MNNLIIPAVITIAIGISALFYFSYDTVDDYGNVQTIPVEKTRPVPEGYISFTYDELSFSINHPESWKTQINWPGDGRPPTIVISPDGEVSSENYDASFITISAEPFSDELANMDEYLELINENIDSQVPSVSSQYARSYVELAGVNAYLIESETDSYGMQTHGLWYTLERNDMLYTISYSSSQSTFESNRDVRDEMLSSFRFI